MASQRFSAEQIFHKLREADAELVKGVTVKQVRRQYSRHDPVVDIPRMRRKMLAISECWPPIRASEYAYRHIQVSVEPVGLIRQLQSM